MKIGLLTAFSAMIEHYSRAELRKLEDRFWSKVQKSEDSEGCWLWTGGKTSRGYGTFQLSRPRGTVLAHRLGWVLQGGEIPEGHGVLHGCDNPPCVRMHEKHLFTGTQLDNIRDCKAKKRHHHGTSHVFVLHPELSCLARLTAEQVAVIRASYASGQVSQQQIARAFGVSRTEISLLVNRKIWRNVS